MNHQQLRVLVVDDNQMMVKTLRDILKIKGYQSEAAFSGPEALEKIEQGNFDCVLSDIKMPDVSGVDLYRAIKAKQPHLPVVLMTAYATDSLIKEGLEEGVVAVLTKPLDINLLLEFLASLTQGRSVVIVDDDPEFCRTLSDVLQAQHFKVKQFTEVDGLVDQLDASEEIVLLDMKLKGHDGLDILREIRDRHPLLPVILITGHKDELNADLKDGLEISAYTYLYKPLQMDELLKILTQIFHQELGRILGRPANKPH